MAKKIYEIFNENEIIQKIKEKLPYLFQFIIGKLKCTQI